MAIKSTLLALAAILLGATAAAAIPLAPSTAQGMTPAPIEGLVAEAHHKPGHFGGRGRHLGWYKGNRGKKKGWRR